MKTYYTKQIPKEGDLIESVQYNENEDEFYITVSSINEDQTINVDIGGMGIAPDVDPFTYMLKKSVDEIKEDKIIKMTAEIWNTFLTLEQTHPCDIDELCDGIHAIQKIIALRVARRVKPDVFITKEALKKN